MALLRLSRTHGRLQRARLAARWDDVLRLGRDLESGLAKMGGAMVAGAVFWQAKALAATGRLDQALALVESKSECTGLPEGTYLNHLAMVYDAANDPNGALECFQRAAEAAADDPAGWLGAAEILAVRLDRPQEARAALDRLRDIPISGLTKAGIGFVEGAIALAEGRLTEARERLEPFRKQMIRRARGTPLALAHVRMSEALLAIAYARAGDLDTARRHAKTALPFLRLHKMDNLIRRCEAEIPEMCR